jgi:hypothetical protein
MNSSSLSEWWLAFCQYVLRVVLAIAAVALSPSGIRSPRSRVVGQPSEGRVRVFGLERGNFL